MTQENNILTPMNIEENIGNIFILEPWARLVTLDMKVWLSSGRDELVFMLLGEGEWRGKKMYKIVVLKNGKTYYTDPVRTETFPYTSTRWMKST